MDIAGTISAVASALSVVKELRAIDAQFDKAELRMKIASLTEALSDAKLGLVDVAEQIHDKDREISELRAKLKYRAENLVDQNGFRYERKDGKAYGAPYCPVCEQKGIYLKLAQDRNTNGHPYKCPSCKADFGPVGVFAK